MPNSTPSTAPFSPKSHRNATPTARPSHCRFYCLQPLPADEHCLARPRYCLHSVRSAPPHPGLRSSPPELHQNTTSTVHPSPHRHFPVTSRQFPLLPGAFVAMRHHPIGSAAPLRTSAAPPPSSVIAEAPPRHLPEKASPPPVAPLSPWRSVSTPPLFFLLPPSPAVSRAMHRRYLRRRPSPLDAAPPRAVARLGWLCAVPVSVARGRWIDFRPIWAVSPVDHSRGPSPRCLPHRGGPSPPCASPCAAGVRGPPVGAPLPLMMSATTLFL